MFFGTPCWPCLYPLHHSFSAYLVEYVTSISEEVVVNFLLLVVFMNLNGTVGTLNCDLVPQKMKNLATIDWLGQKISC